ncbi:hypothetical protein DFR70_110283 [Nocardia tenerifensis]|uniref:DUF1254 domain-containing protein n=1 Tax=Nocardia tenerifensis TaxID=228006 RepID=A0A318JUU7_9NOCA|nr:DUF1254 domain-containing protein [Nocardia tenerifensis]PXX60441.1 hypothetical protein DFR70_110283 [Nocardia tenerifensis]
MGGTEGGLSRRSVFGLAATVAVGLSACGRSDDASSGPDTAAPSEAEAIAKDAYIFGFPLVLMDVTRAAAEAATPANRFQHAAALPTPQRRDVVRLNLDTLYSAAWLDVRAEPMVLQVPAMDGRYWLMQFMDAWTNTVHNPSSVRPQAKSGAPYTYAVVGPGWSGTLPDGVTPLPVPTPTVWLVGRIQVDGAADLPAVRAIQQQLRLAPLSDWTAGRQAPTASPAPQGDSTPPAKQVAELGARDFFDRMCALMATNPPAPDDAPAMKRFATIGITPGGEVVGLSEGELAAAVDTARQQIPVYLDPKSINENGWTFDPAIGTYGTTYLQRATVAWKGLGANLPEDAIYPTLFATAGANGTTGRFRLHFPPGQTPPVAAFWSLTAYDADSYLMPNPAGIYAIGHQTPVVPNPDGSVDLAIQHDDPGPAVPLGNWLPIPASGQFSLTMRLYAPKDEAIQGHWQPPPLTPVS